jgi:hypothetical protein
VFLAAIGAEETQIRASFCAAIRIAREQKSISLATRAEGTYAEYRRQKRARQEDMDSDYLFVDAKREIARITHVTLRIIWHNFLRGIWHNDDSYRLKRRAMIALASFQPGQLGGERRRISRAGR